VATGLGFGADDPHFVQLLLGCCICHRLAARKSKNHAEDSTIPNIYPKRQDDAIFTIFHIYSVG
jgi:hypothetical protein